jgi:hypothetical protein
MSERTPKDPTANVVEMRQRLDREADEYADRNSGRGVAVVLMLAVLCWVVIGLICWVVMG